ACHAAADREHQGGPQALGAGVSASGVHRPLSCQLGRGTRCLANAETAREASAGAKMAFGKLASLYRTAAARVSMQSHAKTRRANSPRRSAIETKASLSQVVVKVLATISLVG